MADLAKVILDQIRSYENTPDVGVEITKNKGLFNRRKTIHVFGAVHSDSTKEKVDEIVRRQAGDDFDVSNELRVTHLQH